MIPEQQLQKEKIINHEYKFQKRSGEKGEDNTKEEAVEEEENRKRERNEINKAERNIRRQEINRIGGD